MSRIKKTLSALIHYYDASRQAGHTTTALYAVKNTQAILVGPNESFCRYLSGEKGVGSIDEHIKLREEGSKIEVISINNLERLEGRREPIVFDNATLHILFVDALREIQRKEESIKKMKSILAEAMRVEE